MISVIIPIYKNKDLFFSILQNNLKYFASCEIIVINDNPNESLRSDMNRFSQVTLIENRENKGFAASVNLGIQKAKMKYVMLLNSDVKLTDDKYKDSIDFFKKDPELFAISFAQKEKDGSMVGKNQLYWINGMAYHQKSPDLKFGLNAWAEGGAAIFDRVKLLELNGFDTLYKPFYWEDIDLSYRAKKLGYRILFDPRIVVEHHHESTIGKYYSRSFIEITAYRNQLLFIWKNIQNKKLLISHFLCMPYNLLYYSLFKQQLNFVKGFLNALKNMNKIVNARKRLNSPKTDDTTILFPFKHE